MTQKGRHPNVRALPEIKKKQEFLDVSESLLIRLLILANFIPCLLGCILEADFFPLLLCTLLLSHTGISALFVRLTFKGTPSRFFSSVQDVSQCLYFTSSPRNQADGMTSLISQAVTSNYKPAGEGQGGK